MKKTLIIDGGLGRVITAIPALETFVQNNKAIIITYYWTSIFWGNKILTPYIFDNMSKGIFNAIKDTEILKPEPYYNNQYLNEKINLADAWNQVINNSTKPADIPKLYISNVEKQMVTGFSKKPVIAFQPFGSTATITDTDVYDPSARSLNKTTTLALIRRLKQTNFDIFLINDRDIPWLAKHDFIDFVPANPRALIAGISNCNYFLGIDSAGQHIARSFNIPGTVFIGGTSAANVTYPNWFNIIDPKLEKEYMHYRLCEFDYSLTEIENSGILDFTQSELKDICCNILDDIKQKLT